MSQQEYETKLRSVHRFIPFLENMITQLKDPKMRNREQQLSKMESLYQMITDKNKKLKLETLQKCEEVIIKLYYKVKGQNATLPSTSQPSTHNREGDRRKPINLYSVAGETINKQKSYNDLYGYKNDNSMSPRPKSFIRKPPISYSDLECLEKDVAHELEKKMSLQELNSLRHQLCKELEDSKADEINTTVRNKPVPTKMNAASPDKNKRKPETITQPKNDQKKEAAVLKKSDPKPAPPKVLKEAGDLFCNVFSEIDKSYGIGLKKKDEKKSGKDKKESKTEDGNQSAETASLKQLSDKAAQIRNHNETIERNKSEQTDATKCSSENVDAISSKPCEDKKIGSEFDTIPLKDANSQSDSLESTNHEKELHCAGVGKINEHEVENKGKSIDDTNADNTSEIPKSEADNSKENKEMVEFEASSDITALKTTESKTDVSEETENKETNESDKVACKDDVKDKDNKDKSKSNKESSDNKEKKHGDHKKDKSEKSHKSDHKKHKEHKSRDKSKEHDKDKDRKDRHKDKSSRDRSSKSAENKDGKEKKHTDKDSKKEKKDNVAVDQSVKQSTNNAEDSEKPKKNDAFATVQTVLNKINSEIKNITKVVTSKENLAALPRELDDNSKNPEEPNIEIPPQLGNKPLNDAGSTIQKEPQTKAVNRDPRLKHGSHVLTSTSQPTQREANERIAFRYNPKPKRQEPEADLEKDVLESIEKSMKESNVPMPPAPVLSAPPKPPDDLFSPESPDEIDKMAVPPILNDLLLNPKTTGMLNEVVSALRRSNNENNLITLGGKANIRKKEHNLHLNQTPGLHFSPPVQKLPFEAPPIEPKIISPSKPPRTYNPFSPNDQNDFERQSADFPLLRNQGAIFEPPANHLKPYEDRMGQGFFIEGPANYVVPSPNYVGSASTYIPPSPSYIPPNTNYVPPSPSYVPPSPLYEGNVESFRELSNYQNFQGQSQRFFDGDRGINRPKGLLGDGPSRFKNPYGQQNYENFNRFGPRGTDFRSNLCAAGSRDPRININRGAQYQDLRPLARESRMTYREYKEQKERENREKEMREKEMKEKADLEKQQTEREEAEKLAVAAKEKEAQSNQCENDKDKIEEKESDRSDKSRTRDRSKERYSNNRSSRYRKDRDDFRNRGDKRDRSERGNRSRDRTRYESKFDKVYSVREKDKELSSPLNDLFTPKLANGKGHIGQYKIPKKVREEEHPVEEAKKNEGTKNPVKKSHDSDKSSKKKIKPKDKKDNKEIENVNESVEADNSSENKSVPEKPEEDKVSVEEPKQTIDEDKATEEKTDSKSESVQKSDNKEETKGNTSEKKEEEENILSKFFQHLMKSSNKDEKKGALLSLISTFSDSFSDHQLQKITSIIRSEDVEDEPKKDEVKMEKVETASTSKENEEKKETKTEIVKEDAQEKIEEEVETIQEKEIPEEKPSQPELVGRMRTRRRNETPKPELKSKMKVKSELDRLHDDIREMFIRDGVVTATGKRMCRMLKDTTTPNSADTEKSEDETNPEEIEKKTVTPRRRGRKPGYRKNKEAPEMEMKELSVVLPKMSLDKIKATEETENKEEEENIDDIEDKVEEHEECPDQLSNDETSDKEIVEKTTRKGRPKKRNAWATGVIKKKPCPKSKKGKVPEVIEKKNKKLEEQEEEVEPEISDKKVKKTVKDEEKEVREEDTPKEVLHDIEYYPKAGLSKMQCKFCDVSTKWIAAHYRTEHPNEEVLSARLSPAVAKTAIADAIKNKEKYENDVEESHAKHEFLCSFCDYKQVTLPKFYRDHVTIHTGEFRHTCPYCSFSRSHIKTMLSHVAEAHAEEEAVCKKPLITDRAPNNRNTYAYICEICNYTQMSLERVKQHAETYHADTPKFEIHKIKMNFEEKTEEKIEPDTKQPSERPTRRSLKASQPLEDETNKKEVVPPTEETVEPSKIEEKIEPETLENYETSNTELESADETKPKTPKKPLRRAKKRGKSFSVPSPAKKRLKRRCTMNRPSTAEVDEEEASEDAEEKTVKNVDEAVFTSNTDIQEENKRIEAERLKTMQDVNSSIKLRTSLDFVEKLSHRLKQEEEVIVKQEAEEIDDDVLEKLPVNDLPVFEKSGIQIRDVEPVSIRQESSSKIGKDGGKTNPINGVIEKLQGILGNPSKSCDDLASPNIPSEESTVSPIDSLLEDAPPTLEIATVLPTLEGSESKNPPPLIHMNSVEQAVGKSNMINSETLNVGLVKIIKTMSTYIYVCCLPPCIFSSRDRTAFTRHCQNNHQWDENSPKSSECLECGVTLTCSEEDNLLTAALNHATTDHSSFLGIKIGSIRISSNLFPENKEKDNMERPSTPPTISIPSPLGEDQEDIDSLLNPDPEEQTSDGDNPFSFKIVDVVSLADEDLPPSDAVNTSQSPEMQPRPQNQNSSPTQATIQTCINTMISQCKWKQQEAVSRKWPMAMKKFLGNHFDLYKCPDYSCLFTTNKRKMFDIHLRMHPNNKKLVYCLYCDKLIVFETAGDHYEKVHGMCRFSCSYCLYRCIAKDYMDIHQILAHPDVPSRMQLLPKRDSEDKNSISILSEATKRAPITPYICCNQEFIHQIPFIEHVENCVENTNYKCFHKTGNKICNVIHKSTKHLVNHWGIKHEVYPLKCAYCSVGDFDLNVMMVHLVVEHPTLPPDIIDRYNAPVNKSKKPVGITSVQCNFKQLVFELKSNSKPKSGDATITPVIYPKVSPTKPTTMQKAFENFVEISQPKPLIPLKNVPKLTAINLLPKPSIALLKPTSKANVLNAGGLVYCLSSAPTAQNSLLKAIVVNQESVATPQKVQLVTAPVTSESDGKYQILNKVMPVKATKPPKLAPLTSVQHLPTIGKVISGGELIALSTPDAGMSSVTDEVCDESDVQKDGNVAGDTSEMESLEEPMVIFEDDLGDKDRDDAVDPLSLETEDPLNTETSKSPGPNATPMHDYDSDSKDVDQQEVLVQKSGLVGYQLFRCAKCDMFFPGSWQFKEHLIESTKCKFENSPHKPYKCFHCGKYLKHYTNLLDHLSYHGHPRFTCSLCNKKYPHANQVKYHMKTQHNITNVQMQPLVQNKTSLITDSFIVKPQVIGNIKSISKENKNESDSQKSAEVKTVYYSFEADQIPQKSILGYDITCGHCKKFKNKVRSNIVRHLLLHQNDKDFTVPDTAPVNPVPCLEKNEKMFDKMCNLASSSHTGGRMGGQQKGESTKDKVKETGNHPAFVPTNKRYQCCAVGCNYLCLEEGNLRHHLTALHMEDLNFVCVHCKKDLSDAVDVDTIIKHLKLHDLHLYKCSSCEYMHSLKHKIERHIGEDHKNKESTVMVIRAMDAEPYDDNQQQPFVPVVLNQKQQKPWRCCMCKYKCHTKEEVVNHVKNKHNIDCRYKCALCTFKTDEVLEFEEHFKTSHPDSEVDIISVYHKDDENKEVAPETDQFDTTPLWLRDKPRVRHIRGILFEEDTAMKKKTNQAKTDQAPKDTPGSKKRKRSFSTPNESNKIEDEGVEPKKEISETKIANKPVDNDVIVIDDDDVEEPKENPTELKEPEKKQELNDVDLICMFGDIGMPISKNFKCPKCEKYKTTKMRDFIQHVAGELRYYRFLCKKCQEKFITLENIQMHCIDYHDCSVKSVVHLPVEESMNKWLTLLLTGQRKIMTNLGFACEEIPEQIEEFLGRMEVFNKSIKCKECGFTVSGTQALDRHMKYNHPHIAYAQPSRSSAEPPSAQTSSADKKRPSEEPQESSSDPKKMKMTAKANSMVKDKYVCRECAIEFNSVPEMEFHCKENHDGVIGYTVKTTNLPIGLGANRNIYRCRYCPTTGNKASLELHIANDHPGQKLDVYRFSCGFCSAKFEVLKSFRQHFKSHELSDMYYYDVYDRKVMLKGTSANTPKTKTYRCPKCPYRSNSINSANIKHHLKIHAKPFQCEMCQSQFKTRPEAKAHHSKEHPHNPEMISTRQDMVKLIEQMMKEVMKTVTEMGASDKALTDESVEEELPQSALQPEVILRWDDDEQMGVEEDKTNRDTKKYFAKKSTASKMKPDETKDYYSFYGMKKEPVDMRKITTNFEIADAKVKMSCDQLARIYNLNPVIRLKDCMTLIIDDDDVLSS